MVKTWLFGAAMVVTGAVGPVTERIGESLINWGIGLIGLTFTTYVGGSTAERWAAWTSAMRGGKSRDREGGWGGGYDR